MKDLANTAISGPSHYLKQNNIKGFHAVKFRMKVSLVWVEMIAKTMIALITKKASLGPFQGEFGNFLGHVLPFISFLHRYGVRVSFCGFEILKPYIIDPSGNSIVTKFYPLRDIYAEAPPSTNFGPTPADVQAEIRQFVESEVGWAHFDLSNHFFYWFVYRFVVAKLFSHTYDISCYYGSSRNACAIFPRKKGLNSTKNNGEPWDYQAVVDLLKKYFDEIYVVGHPAHVSSIKNQEKVCLVVTSDNEQILRALSSSSLILTPHSGVVYLASLLRKKVLLLYKGGNKISDIGSIQNTLFYLKSMSGVDLLSYCFSLDELEKYARNHIEARI